MLTTFSFIYIGCWKAEWTQIYFIWSSKDQKQKVYRHPSNSKAKEGQQEKRSPVPFWTCEPHFNEKSFFKSYLNSKIFCFEPQMNFKNLHESNVILSQHYRVLWFEYSLSLKGAHARGLVPKVLRDGGTFRGRAYQKVIMSLGESLLGRINVGLTS